MSLSKQTQKVPAVHDVIAGPMCCSKKLGNTITIDPVNKCSPIGWNRKAEPVNCV